MKIITVKLHLETRGNGHTIDITPYVSKHLEVSGLLEGTAVIFFPGSTGGITTIEYEDGVIRDLKMALERNYPENITYYHDQKWHDGNGHSHVRAAVIGPSITIPFIKGQLMLGRWQQIIVIDFDTRPRSRQIIVQYQGVLS